MTIFLSSVCGIYKHQCPSDLTESCCCTSLHVRNVSARYNKKTDTVITISLISVNNRAIVFGKTNYSIGNSVMDSYHIYAGASGKKA